MVEPRVVVRQYAAKWTRAQVDLVELANLRRVKGWSLTRIAAHFGVAKGTVVNRLKGIL